jgi:hypothetical protein
MHGNDRSPWRHLDLPLLMISVRGNQVKLLFSGVYRACVGDEGHLPRVPDVSYRKLGLDWAVWPRQNAVRME